MPTLLLVRHGRTPANAEGILAGRTPGVHLDDVGREQASRVGRRLAELPITALVTSPLERAVETAKLLAQELRDPPRLTRDKGFVECSYGTWTGRPLKELAKESLWSTVQSQPSAARFPDGESLTQMYARAVAAVRTWDARIAEEHGSDALWVTVSHGDVIKAIVADAYGMHLDSFQRIMVGPGSLSVIQHTTVRPYVAHVNDTGSDLSWLKPPARRRRRKRSSDAVVGGGA
ncbi:MAG: MSMEG_4193 family putative phosphomutase [Actinomycetota bacterium]|nr:MSMEG_4193 family putative phosphomutase [Actinomycetota bacterium]